MIAWREEMSIGVKAIDDDHRYLISIINEFDACQNRQNAEKTCKRLFTYAQTHFQREEALQDEFDYPHASAHKQAHAGIVERLRGIIRSSFISGDGTVSDEALIADLSALLRDWVVDHVMRDDLDMRPFFRSVKAARSSDSLLPPSAQKHHRPQSSLLRTARA